MKKIAIISPDTVPLPILKDAPDMILQDNKEVSLRDKCSRATSLGMRAWKMAEQLSKNFKVTLFIPDINYPLETYVDSSKLFCDITSYSYELCKHYLEPRLQKTLLDYDIVIIQTNSGTAFWNCAYLPEKVKLIVDGWTVLPVELPLSLMGYDEEYKKEIWEEMMIKYYALIKRADCILYNLDAHRYYYEGLLLTIKKGAWNFTKKSNLIRLTFGMDENKRIQNESNSTKLKLLWYGPAYPWYDPESLIKAVSGLTNVELDFYAIKHPRFYGSYDRLFESVFKSANCSHIKINLDYQDNHWELYKKYDAGIIISKGDLESLFSLRIRVMDMLSYGLPVISNDEYPFESRFNIKDAVFPVSLNNLKQDLKVYSVNKYNLRISDESFGRLQGWMSWEESVQGLTEYIGNI